MSHLLIKLKRSLDGSTALTATRADGFATWQRQTGQHGHFFSVHDLTHYAVETVLGCRAGFFGLIADGWEISDFAPPFARGPIPAEAREIEVVVSLIETAQTAAEFREQSERYVSGRRAVGREADDGCVFSDDQLERIRALRQELIERWFRDRRRRGTRAGLRPVRRAVAALPASVSDGN